MLIDLFENKEFLVEKQNYELMFKEFIDLLDYYSSKTGDKRIVSEIKDKIKNQIKHDKKEYKRVDFITTVLLFRRVDFSMAFTRYLLNFSRSGKEQMNAYYYIGKAHAIIAKYVEKITFNINNQACMIYFHDLESYNNASSSVYDLQLFYGRFLDQMTHYIDLHEQTGFLEGFSLFGKRLDDAFAEMDERERRYNEAVGDGILEEKLTDNWEIIMSFPDGYAWLDLNTSVSNDEAKMMGHCCSDPRTRNGGTVYSLRKIRKGPNGKKIHTSHVTFMIKDKLGYEIKGKGNEKPVEKYHPYLVALIKTDLINDLVGGGYLANNNFMISDLSDEDKNDLLKVKPVLMPLDDLIEKHGHSAKIVEQKVEKLLNKKSIDVKIQNGRVLVPIDHRNITFYPNRFLNIDSVEGINTLTVRPYIVEMISMFDLDKMIKHYNINKEIEDHYKMCLYLEDSEVSTWNDFGTTSDYFYAIKALKKSLKGPIIDYLDKEFTKEFIGINTKILPSDENIRLVYGGVSETDREFIFNASFSYNQALFFQDRYDLFGAAVSIAKDRTEMAIPGYIRLIKELFDVEEARESLKYLISLRQRGETFLNKCLLDKYR